MQAIFRTSVLETVSAPHEITETQEKVLAWNGWTLNTGTWALSSKDGTGNLSEVVYYLGPESAEVLRVVLIFVRASVRIAVRVESATFLAKLAGAASAPNVAQVTIPGSMKHMDAPSPQTISATLAMGAQFPAVERGFDTVVHGARANTALTPILPHIVARYAGPRRTRTMYFGLDRNPLAYTDLTYGGKRVWTTESLAAATLTLVVGPVLASDGLNDAQTPDREIELTRQTPTDCFAGELLSLCPVTGKLQNGSDEYDLAEILYVPFDALDNGTWACVLHFRPVKGTQPAFALRLAPESTDMLMTVANMRLPVLTSTAIRGLVTSLPPWPNAHSQGTTNAPVVSSLSDTQSLMPATRARMIYSPSSGSPSVVRYEPVPSCAQYAGNRTDRKGWAMWPLCSADAAARARSPACNVFRECAPQPGASTASLVDARDPKSPLVVPLYESKELGVMYGLTQSAVYVVRPVAQTEQAAVVVATERRAERFLATKDASGRFTIVAVEPPCAELARCMKGTDLSECYLWSNDCAQREDRSPIVARLEYDGAPVELRELDADVLYGVDSRGAFALNIRTGSAVLAPGIKAPTWPRKPDAPLRQGAPLFLTATFSSGAWRVGPAKTEETEGDSRAGLWIIIGVALALAVLFGILFVASKRAKTVS